MPRRYTAVILAIFMSTAVAAGADDFWVSKDWKQWSKDDCEKLLGDSPWAHIWRNGNTTGDKFVFVVQLRSALPIRQAIVRQLQFQQSYDKLNDTQRSDFDRQANNILNRSYDDAILVHVNFSRGLLGLNLSTDFRRLPKELDTLDVTLVTNEHLRIKANRVDLSQKEAAFDATFPRMQNGAPVLAVTQAHLWIQFARPSVLDIDGRTYPGGPVEVEFVPAKMVVGGKFLY
jgi:hypothetical protein